ncbi:MAG: Na/Pi cotransporter family protein [Victivallaceae bacterium]|nr:Na/Pi cotransporter family protein [Victivallaceae bacterium]
MTLLALNVFGGLAIFIFGMKMMSDGLHLVAGEKMRAILRLFSANRFIAILSGAAVTAVIQSSSASTVMVIGFVNAGLLNLVQAIGIIFGANIGTTITAQLVAFEIGWIIMPAIIAGVLFSFLPSPRWSGWGTTIIGLGLLFLGMQIMSEELKALSSHPGFAAAFQTFRCAPVNGVIPPLALLGAIGIGLGATLIIQSSSACTGIIIALGAGGLIDLYTAVALVMGANIGTTITAQLAAIPANRVAKQAALAHTLFNVFGVCIIVGTFWITWGKEPVFFHLVNWISADGDLPRRIANAHTIFNVCTTLILFPLIPFLARVCEKLIPKAKEKVKYQRLEPLLLNTPSIALVQTSSALHKMLKKAWEMVECSLKIYNRNDKANQAMVKQLEEREQKIDERQHEITEYLALLMQRPLTSAQAEQIPLLLHCTNDTERIGDHTAVIRALMEKFHSDKCVLSSDAEEEFEKLFRLLSRQAQCTLALLKHCTAQQQKDAAGFEEEIDRITDRCEAAHMRRMNNKECRPAAGVLYLELLSEIRKVSRHLANIAQRADAFSEIESPSASGMTE